MRSGSFCGAGGMISGSFISKYFQIVVHGDLYAPQRFGGNEMFRAVELWLMSRVKAKHPQIERSTRHAGGL